MANAVNQLATTVSGEALWGVFGDTIVFVGGVVLFAFGFYMIKKLIKGVAKGKVRM